MKFRNYVKLQNQNPLTPNLSRILILDISYSAEILKQTDKSLINTLHLIPETADQNRLRILNDLMIECNNIALSLVVWSDENFVLLTEDERISELLKRNRRKVTKN